MDETLGSLGCAKLVGELVTATAGLLWVIEGTFLKDGVEGAVTVGVGVLWVILSQLISLSRTSQKAQEGSTEGI